MSNLKDRKDDELQKAVLEGDDSAFEALVKRHADKLINFFFRLCWCRETAEDLAQDCFIKAYTSIKKTGASVAFSRLLYRIAKISWYSHLRKVYRSVKTSGGVEMLAEPPEKSLSPSMFEDAEKAEQVRRMHSAIERLPEEHRLVIEMAYLMEIPYKEISEILEIPIGTVKSRINAAVLKLRGLMERSQTEL